MQDYLKICPDLDGIETVTTFKGITTMTDSLEECPDLEGIETYYNSTKRLQ
jgi:hypothetical protein